MNTHDLQLEELYVPEPVCLPLHRLDFVVGILKRTGGNGGVVLVEDTSLVRGEGSSPWSLSMAVLLSMEA